MTEQPKVIEKEMTREEMAKHHGVDVTRIVFQPGLGQTFNPFEKWPSNWECFCGSSVKFKKCCRAKLAHYISEHDAKILKQEFDRVYKFVQTLHEHGRDFKIDRPEPKDRDGFVK